MKNLTSEQTLSQATPYGGVHDPPVHESDGEGLHVGVVLGVANCSLANRFNNIKDMNNGSDTQK